MKVCVIPARGGSKRITKKNIKDFLGQPIIKYSIDKAKSSKIFDQIIVSTDNIEIAKIASKFGANVPFLRPKEISDDYSGIPVVINHVISFLKEQASNPEYICCLLATAPFVKESDLINGFNSLKNVAFDRFTFSATKYLFPIQRALRIENSLSYPISKIDIKKRSQDLDDSFHDAGQFYWGNQEAWSSKKNLFEGSLPILLPSWRVQDLDTLEDWKRAELMYKVSKQEGLL